MGVALATHAHTFTDTDSINLARGLQHYTVVNDSPHPGYPLVVLTTCVIGVVLGRPPARAVIVGLLIAGHRGSRVFPW